MRKQLHDRERAIKSLIENVRLQDFIPDEGDPAYVFRNGRTVFMPAYVPYVGHSYFEHRPRILCYAINQNLSKHRGWSNAWMQEWATASGCAIDRLNHAAERRRALPVKPYAEGFIPLTALLWILANATCGGERLPDIIDTVISVTNFVKFSKSDSASSSDIPDSWWRECGSRYVRHEISILKPDVIITFGGKTHRELKRVLSCTNYHTESVRVQGCRFPGRIPSQIVRPARGREGIYWKHHILPLASRIECPRESYVSQRMTRFPRYFLDIAKAWDLL